jgi:hypothetical protein
MERLNPEFVSGFSPECERTGLSGEFDHSPLPQQLLDIKPVDPQIPVTLAYADRQYALPSDKATEFDQKTVRRLRSANVNRSGRVRRRRGVAIGRRIGRLEQRMDADAADRFNIERSIRGSGPPTVQHERRLSLVGISDLASGE